MSQNIFTKKFSSESKIRQHLKNAPISFEFQHRTPPQDPAKIFAPIYSTLLHCIDIFHQIYQFHPTKRQHRIFTIPDPVFTLPPVFTPLKNHRYTRKNFFKKVKINNFAFQIQCPYML